MGNEHDLRANQHIEDPKYGESRELLVMGYSQEFDQLWILHVVHGWDRENEKFWEQMAFIMALKLPRQMMSSVMD